jgi:hypothetical protein
MTSALEANGPKKYFPFSKLLELLYSISLLKMQKQVENQFILMYNTVQYRRKLVCLNAHKGGSIFTPGMRSFLCKSTETAKMCFAQVTF